MAENGEIIPGSLWLYAPNTAAPIVISVYSGLFLLIHTFLTTKHHTWSYTYILPLLTLSFTLGYILRAIGSHHFDSIPLYLASTIFIFIAPPLLELQNYHVLSRLLHYVPYHAPMHPGRVTSTFLIISVLVEVLNGVGIAWVASPNAKGSLRETGHVLQKVSLILQLCVVACYYALSITFHLRCTQIPAVEKRIRTMMTTLYMSSGLVLVRTIYRTVEYFGDDLADIHTKADLQNVGPLLRYEWFFWVFECVPMAVCVAMWAVLFPGRWLPRSERVVLGRDGVTESIEEVGWVDRRNFWVTVLDPFGWLIKEKGRKGEGEERKTMASV